MQFQQQLTKELQKQMGIRKQLADLQISEIERAANQAIEDATASGDIRTVFQDDEQFKLQALEDLVEEGQILFYKPSKLGMIITVPTPGGPYIIVRINSYLS